MKRAIVFLVHMALWVLLYGIIFFISDTFLSFSRPAYGVIPGQVSYTVALYIVALIALPFYIPGRHNLLIADRGNIFVVRLTIDTNEN